MPATLTAAALDTLLAEPLGVELLYRPPTGGRWKSWGRFPAMRDAVARVHGSGEWWLRELRAEDVDDGPSLLDMLTENDTESDTPPDTKSDTYKKAPR